jgi:hypothetical protein
MDFPTPEGLGTPENFADVVGGLEVIQYNDAVVDAGFCQTILIPLPPETPFGHFPFRSHHLSDFMGSHNRICLLYQAGCEFFKQFFGKFSLQHFLFDEDQGIKWFFRFPEVFSPVSEGFIAVDEADELAVGCQSF